MESILPRDSGKPYAYGSGARAVRHSASLAGGTPDERGIENHDAFAARLKREHGRKWSFRQLLRER